jgi:hypothetical protein
MPVVPVGYWVPLVTGAAPRLGVTESVIMQRVMQRAVQMHEFMQGDETLAIIATNRGRTSDVKASSVLRYKGENSRGTGRKTS